MIVETDFLNHWKTRLFVAEIVEYCNTRNKPNGNPTETQIEPSGNLWRNQPFPVDGPIGILLRVWAHCHQRKTGRFEKMSARMLAAICEWTGDADWLFETLIEVGFLDREGSQIVVHEWEETNASLVSSWRNGLKGGRPKKQKEKPNGNPTETQREPIEKRREEKSTPPTPSRGDSSSSGLDSGGDLTDPESSAPGEVLDFSEKQIPPPPPGLPSRAELKRASRAEKKRRRCEGLLPLMKDLGGCIPGRSRDRAWTWEEYEALCDLGAVDSEDLADVLAYYSAKLPKDRDFRRRELITLLNNLHGDVPKCRERLKELERGGPKGSGGLKVHVIGGGK